MKLLQLDPTSISKEVKRNHIPINNKYGTESNCDKLKRRPYFCDNCPNKFGNCPFVKFKYVAKTANDLANAKLINSRRVLDIANEELKNTYEIYQSLLYSLKNNKLNELETILNSKEIKISDYMKKSIKTLKE